MSDLTERDVEVLDSLLYVNHQSRHPRAWVAPLDIGGSDGSHHSNTLRRLAKRGLVQFKQRGAPDPEGWANEDDRGKRYTSRGSKCYRITPDGTAALAAFKASGS